MNEEARRARNVEMLRQCWPPFAALISRLIFALEQEALRPRINEGGAWRDPVAQAKAYYSGKSDLLWGFHNATGRNGEKEALAVDLIDDDSPAVPRPRFVHRVNEIIGAFGLMTGILWSNRKGIRLTEAEKAAIVAACKSGDWSGVERIGYDPLHIQPIGLSVADAKAGKRP